MRRRCPSHRFVDVARLHGYRLDFTRRSPRRRCGTADVVPNPGDEVWGILYKIPNLYDVKVLDRAEGFNAERKHANAYWRIEETVVLANYPGGQRRAAVYIARKQNNPPLPSRAYMAHLIYGARHWGLPPNYIETLERIPIDPDRLS